MMTSDAWRIEYFVEDSGRNPVQEFLQRLDTKTQLRFAWSIEQLRVRNVQAHRPLVRQLAGDIWELREESQTNIYRLLYAFASGRRIVFFHGFQKKTQNTPRREIEVAARRLAQFQQREAPREGGA